MGQAAVTFDRRRPWPAALAACAKLGCTSLATNTGAAADASTDAAVAADARFDVPGEGRPDALPGRCGVGAVVAGTTAPWSGGSWALLDVDFETWRPARCGEAVPLSTMSFAAGQLCRTGGRFYQGIGGGSVFRYSPSFSRATRVLRGLSANPSLQPEVAGFTACAPGALFATASTAAGDDALLRFDDPEAPGCVLWSARHQVPSQGGLGFGWIAATDSFVAWLYRDGNGISLRVADADGGNARVVAGGLSDWAKLRAEGDRLVFAVGGDLWLYTHSSERLENLTRTGSVRSDPDLSGERVAWLDARDAPPIDERATEVYAMDLRDRLSTRLTRSQVDRPVRRTDVSIGDDWLAWIEVARTAQVVSWQPGLRSEVRGYHLVARREVLLAVEPLPRQGTRIIDGALYFNCWVPTLGWGLNTVDGGTHRLALPTLDALAAEPGVVGEGAGCDLSRRRNACATGSSCQPGEGVPSCVRDGTRGGQCRLGLPPCDAGLVCNPVTETCATEAAPGAPCDPSGRAGVCADGRRCTSASGAPVCAEDGAIGGRCQSRTLGTNLCLASGLRCGLDARCVREVPQGEACDPSAQTTACTTRQNACVARASGPVCGGIGEVGAGCRLPSNSAPGAPRCNAGLACSERRLCLEVVPEGSPCDSSESLNSCTRGTVCVAADRGHRCAHGPYVFEALGAADFIDACALGRRLPLAGRSRDETHTAAPVEIPFPFRFYGSARSAIWPSLNGYAVFGRRPPQESTRGPLPLEVEDDVVAPLLSDLTLGDDGAGICATVVGAAPARSLVIVWESLRRRDRPEARLRFALSLHEDGTLDFVYDRLEPAGDAAYDTGAWAFVQGPPGTLPAAYGASVASGLGLRLRPSP
jgi:hypothetical protein